MIGQILAERESLSVCACIWIKYTFLSNVRVKVCVTRDRIKLLNGRHFIGN